MSILRPQQLEGHLEIGKERTMKHKKIVPIFLGLTLITLAACSSSFGSGDPPPNQVKVVVPPNSTTYSSPN